MEDDKESRYHYSGLEDFFNEYNENLQKQWRGHWLEDLIRETYVEECVSGQIENNFVIRQSPDQVTVGSEIRTFNFTIIELEEDEEYCNWLFSYNGYV